MSRPGGSGPRNPGDWPLKAASVGVGMAAVLTAGVVVRGAPSDPAPLDVYWDAPAFALVDQLGDTVSSRDLLGRPWVASFIFTRCAGVCPVITARMAQIRDSLRARGELGEAVRLVSFTVDPARDTPAALQTYAARFDGSPPGEWAFLTGTPPAAVRRLVQDGFRLTAVEPDPADSDGGYQVAHSARVVLVDGKGRIRGTYDGTDPGTPSAVLRDLRWLALEPGDERGGR